MLVEHGIQTEQSDIRAHVSVSDKTVYIFSTARALKVIDENDWKPRDVFSNVNGEQIKTAIGYLAPVDILKPRKIHVPEVIDSAGFVVGGYKTTSDKGRKAQRAIELMLERGLFPLPVSPQIVSNVEMQRSGYDLIVHGQWKIEVKCDWRIGETGNVFLQIAESNPLKQY